MSVVASEITGNMTVCPTTCSDYHQTKHHGSPLLAFCEWIYHLLVDFLHRGPVMQRAWEHFHVVMSHALMDWHQLGTKPLPQPIIISWDLTTSKSSQSNLLVFYSTTFMHVCLGKVENLDVALNELNQSKHCCAITRLRLPLSLKASPSQ